jgi:hypothetical protein
VDEFLAFRRSAKPTKRVSRAAFAFGRVWAELSSPLMSYPRIRLTLLTAPPIIAIRR